MNNPDNEWWCNHDQIKTMWLSFPFLIAINFPADGCYNYSILSNPERKSSYVTPHETGGSCDGSLAEGWYRFVGAAGTKMPTMRVPAFRCNADWSGWLKGAEPTVEDNEVNRLVCFSDRSTGCKFTINILVKNCGSYFIYKLRSLTDCNSRYCGTEG